MTTPYYTDERVTLHHGDCLDVLAAMPDASVDAIVTDPPYGLGFMGEAWDDLPPGLPWAVECLRVLKPGGMMLSFGGTRTWHRLACAAEDAGFEIRDSLAWLYAQGFPKNLNVTKALESLPACSCGVGAEVGGDRLGAVDATGPAGSVRACVGAKAGTVGLARPTADAAGRIGKKVSPATPLGASDMDALGEVTVGEGLPVVLGPLAVAGAAKGQEVVGPVRHVEVNPEALWDEVVGQESVGVAAVSTPPVALDDCGCDVHPSSPLVLPLAATPSRVATPGHAVAVGGGHAGAGAVDSLVGPAAELLSADDADVDTIASTLHDSQYTAERAVRCESCGGVRGEIPRGLGTALKPAFEPVVVARKPLQGTVASNVLAHGTGALNVDGCRVGAGLFVPGGGGNLPSGGIMGRKNSGKPSTAGHTSGRWPANVMLGHTPDCDVIYEGRGEIRLEGPCAPGCPVAELDRQSGESSSRVGKPRGAASGDGWGMTATGAEYADSGGASRFFYTTKAPSAERPKANGIAHATVKPLDLMRWLVRLVTPPGGVVLDPFAGSGTTLEAAIVEGFRSIGIEREADYLPLIEQRIARACPPLDFTEATA